MSPAHLLAARIRFAVAAGVLAGVGLLGLEGGTGDPDAVWDGRRGAGPSADAREETPLERRGAGTAQRAGGDEPSQPQRVERENRDEEPREGGRTRDTEDRPESPPRPPGPGDPAPPPGPTVPDLPDPPPPTSPDFVAPEPAPQPAEDRAVTQSTPPAR